LSANEQLEQLRSALTKQSARGDELAAELQRQCESTAEMQRRFEDAIMNLRQQLPINGGITTTNTATPITNNNNSNNNGGLVSLSATPLSASVTSTPSMPSGMSHLVNSTAATGTTGNPTL
jgi:hypothetical protein